MGREVGDTPHLENFADLSPDIYRKNPFRLLGLPSSARLKQVKRRASTMVSQIESGDAASLADYIIAGLTPLVDEPDIREASHCLESPEKRLMAELFWFRTDDSSAVSDLSFSGIRNDVTSWLEAEASQGEDATTATHNLVVFYHLVALQIEWGIDVHVADTDPGLSAYHVEADAAWRKVFVKWRRLHRSEVFDAWLKTRFETIARGRLPDDDYDALKGLLKTGPLVQVLTLAYAHARKNRLAETDRLRRTVLDNGISKKLLAETAERFLQSPVDRLLKSIEVAQTDIGNDAASAALKATELMDRTLPDLNGLIKLLGDSHHIVANVGDTLGSAVNRAQLEVSDNLQDYATSRKLLLRVTPYVRSPELLPILESNLSYVSCHFCREAPRDQGEAYPFKVSRITSYIPSTGQYNFDHSTIEVPRCANCRRNGTGSAAEPETFIAVKERLDQGWLAKGEPDDSDLTDFLRRNG